MGTICIDAVWFQAYADDHLPAHVHGFTGAIEVIIDLLDNGTTALLTRKRNIIPTNAKAADVRKILETAAQNSIALKTLWEKTPCKARISQ